MHLSEAIKAGATLRPQGFGTYRATHRRWPWSTPEVRTCALGAAYEAIGADRMLLHEEWRPLASQEWGPLLYGATVCPHCGVPGVLVRVITHLNDTHRWPRERIAKWVAYLERK